MNGAEADIAIFQTDAELDELATAKEFLAVQANDISLAAPTLLVAESAPGQKDTLIRLVMNMLAHPEAST
jgi:hypothetical protein